ncbi:unnamed protein product, partial [Iphiclides podalirius]
MFENVANELEGLCDPTKVGGGSPRMCRSRRAIGIYINIDISIHLSPVAGRLIFVYVSQSQGGGYATVGRAPRGPLASSAAPPEPPAPESAEQQLRYENDRLKLALAQRWVHAVVGPRSSLGCCTNEHESTLW